MILQRFYLSIRRALFHHIFAKMKNPEPPPTLLEYERLPSSKLDALATILVHHLSTPGALPLTNAQYEDRAPKHSDNRLFQDPVPLVHVAALAAEHPGTDAVPGGEAPVSRNLAPYDLSDDEDDMTGIDSDFESDIQRRRCPFDDVPRRRTRRATARRVDRLIKKASKTLPPDKIVVFMSFTSHNEYLNKVCFNLVNCIPLLIMYAPQVLQHYAIAPLFLNGNMTMEQRREVIETFMDSPDPQVLVLSEVGIAGLNLDCANIIIIVVCYPDAFYLLCADCDAGCVMVCTRGPAAYWPSVSVPPTQAGSRL